MHVWYTPGMNRTRTDALRRLRAAHGASRAARGRAAAARDELLAAFLTCRGINLTYDDMAAELGVSKSRIAQLARQAEDRRDDEQRSA